MFEERRDPIRCKFHLGQSLQNTLLVNQQKTKIVLQVLGLHVNDLLHTVSSFQEDVVPSVGGMIL